MKKNTIRCPECGYCREFRRVGNTRSSFTCQHPDGSYIHQYFVAHKVRKMERFLGYGERHSHKVPLKTSPAWCPEKAGRVPRGQGTAEAVKRSRNKNSERRD